MGLSCIFTSSTTACDCIDQWSAHVRRAVAAILHEEGQQVPETGHFDQVSDASALPASANEPGILKLLQVSRRCVLHGPEALSDLAGCNSVRSGADKKPEDIEARFLSQCRQRG